MALERILGTDTGKEAFYKSDRNFQAIQEPSYSASIVKQEPVFSLGTDVIKGQVPINAKGLSVVNMVKNGNFVNTNNWIGSTLSVANNEGTFTVLSQWGYLAQTIGGVINDKIYYSALIKTESNLVKLGINYAGGYGAGDIAHSGSGNYEKISAIATIPTIPSINYPTILVQDYRTSGWTAIKAKNVLAINLTAMFGATIANALTKDQCDKMLANWFDGIGNVNNVRIKSVGKNLFDVDDFLLNSNYSLKNYLGKNCLSWLAQSATNMNGRVLTGRFKPNTQYIIKLDMAVASDQSNIFIWYIDGTYTAFQPQVTSTMSFTTVTFTSDVGKTILSISGGWNATQLVYVDIDTFQIEEGIVATAYEPYQESISYIPKLCSLPNGVKDESVEGKLIKRIGEKTLVASDITELLTLTNVDIVRMKLTDFSHFKWVDVSATTNYNQLLSDKYSWAPFSDEVVKVGTFYYSNTTWFNFVVAKGAYASLAAAQAALVGTKIIYELATPIVSDLVTPLTVFPKGTISVESDSETTIPELTLRYPIDIAGVIEELNDGVNQNSKRINDLNDKFTLHSVDASIKVTHNVAQSIASGAVPMLAFNTEIFKVNVAHDNVVNNSRLICTVAGKYLIHGKIEYDANVDGSRAVGIKLNTSIDIGEVNRVPNLIERSRVEVVVIYNLNVGDYVELYPYQTSGGLLNITTNIDFSMIKVG